MERKVELGIIGGGIAGLSAAVYAKRSGLESVIFEGTAIGGQLLLMDSIDNYVGLGLGTKAREVLINLQSMVSGLDLEVISKTVNDVKVNKEGLSLNAEGLNYLTKGLIIASGAKFKRLGVKGEGDFIGKGVSYCAVCDGFFFKGKDVAVIGGGNNAVEEALYLSDIANKVFLIHRRDKLRALSYLQKDLFSRKNIEILFNSRVKEVKGSEAVESINIEDTNTGQNKMLPLQGVFIAIGVGPSTDIFKDLVSRDEDGFIVTDENLKTNLEQVWACGDCRKRPLRQLITAASEGAIAAISAYRHIKGRYISS